MSAQRDDLPSNSYPVPPLPDARAMLDHSDWIAGRAQLREYARHWLEVAPPHRDDLFEQAMELATPSLGWTTLGAVARAGGRVVAAVGPDGLADIFQLATE